MKIDDERESRESMQPASHDDDEFLNVLPIIKCKSQISIPTKYDTIKNHFCNANVIIKDYRIGKK